MEITSPQDDDSLANEIIARSRHVYEQCDSYIDVGLHHGSIGVRDEAPFVTYFQRPDRFRFEYMDSHPHEASFSMRGVIVRDELGPASLWHLYGTEEPEVEQKPIELAIAALTGVSHGTAHHVPYQLLRLMSGRDRWKYQLLSDTEFDGHRCFRVSTTEVTSLVAWIDQQSFLVRRTEWHMEYPSVTVYRPRLNPSPLAFPPRVFAFKPAMALESPLGDGETIARELRPLIGTLPKPKRDDRFDDWPTEV